MQELSWFLPSWPPAFGELVLFGALLVAGLLGGELVHRLASLPRLARHQNVYHAFFLLDALKLPPP